jgi:nicotinamidase-related amidase
MLYAAKKDANVPTTDAAYVASITEISGVTTNIAHAANLLDAIARQMRVVYVKPTVISVDAKLKPGSLVW